MAITRVNLSELAAFNQAI